MRLEELYAWGILLKAVIENMEQYTAWLYDALMKVNKEEPFFDLLADLAYCSNDINKTLTTINDYTISRESSFDFAFIGGLLIKSLEEAYKAGTYDLQTLGAQAYCIWAQLPVSMGDEPPFSA